MTVTYYTRAANVATLYLHRAANQGDVWVLTLTDSVAGYDRVATLGLVYTEQIAGTVAVVQCRDDNGITLFTTGGACDAESRWTGPTSAAGWFVANFESVPETNRIYRKLRDLDGVRQYVWVRNPEAYDTAGFAYGNETWGIAG